ncbi:hypothetical protein H696_03264 [Fonticula alba]|uniref:R-spondin Fu-CRD domain-containing protein n=1 Tax=Fonticula alba TaxID=691883 RepID=A0A058Z7A1_FONAL|nr:hypothetical protein H696_03264 [Fonticula alba]KCV69808.1 hypothetical protein H696_03264 [Fonticula alba]|eukprot:XP_009495414.1 hypothetical protein H696_03264 [Fonticula alba]
MFAAGPLANQIPAARSLLSWLLLAVLVLAPGLHGAAGQPLPGARSPGRALDVACPRDTFADPAEPGRCLPCAPFCAICTGGSWADCVTCKRGFSLEPMVGCVSGCPEDFFMSDDLAGCVPCASSCVRFSQDDPGACAACAEDFFLDPSSGQCVCTCPAQWLGTGGKCVPCAEDCHQCVMSPDNCHRCRWGKFKTRGPAPVRCVDACPPGEFPHATGLLGATLQCALCSPACAECDGPEEDACTSCPIKDGVQWVLAEEGLARCLAACPPGQYADARAVCRPCDPACGGVCVGAGPQGCDVGLVLPPPPGATPSPSAPGAGSSSASASDASASLAASSSGSEPATGPGTDGATVIIIIIIGVSIAVIGALALAGGVSFARARSAQKAPHGQSDPVELGLLG